MNEFFQPCFSWQAATWQRLTQQFPHVPHALLFAGAKGTGKTLFAQRFAAWVLCQNKQATANHAHACGSCQSCHWLQSHTHPNFLHVTVAADSKSDTIKVDDVRAILPFAQQSSSGMRVIFIEQAERMNVSAANALLKTLEEPPANVLFLLTSHQPQLLLATIRSRVQAQEVSHVSEAAAIDYVENLANYTENAANTLPASQLLAMVGGSPLLINDLLAGEWLAHRKPWLAVWQALRTGQKDSVSASQYWQKQMRYDAAFTLQMLMCRDVLAVINHVPVTQADINFDILAPLPSADAIAKLETLLLESKQALKQNIQAGYLYDKLMATLALT